MLSKIDGVQNGQGIRWPDEKRIAVMLTFDMDAEFLHVSRCKSKEIKAGFREYSQGQYGPHEGIWRCLNLLDSCGVKGTFFVPGIVVEQYKRQVQELHNRGHEIACHGYRHESVRGISWEEEEILMEKSENLIKDITGKKPVGHRGPDGIIHPFTPKMLLERGYLYSASMKDCDWAYLYQLDGKRAPLIELPGDVTMDDFTYYFLSPESPVKSVCNNKDVADYWKAEFDGLAREGDKILVIKLHPQLIGRASRIAILGELIGYMKRRGAWIATCEEVARYVLLENSEVTLS